MGASHAHDAEVGLGPPQFRLRTLLFAMTLLSALFAVMSAVGAVWSVMLVFFLALVAAHVVGNALGTRLRASADRSVTDPWAGGLIADRQSGAAPRILPAQRMHEKTGLSRLMVMMAIVGAATGAIGGGGVLTCWNWQQITPAAIVLATLSSAVLGGFCGFLASSFLSVFMGALGEALDNGERPMLSPRSQP